MVGTANNSLAFRCNRSDESSCANQAQKGFTIMTNAEATITENAATVAEQDAHIAPKKASSKKVARQKKDARKGQKAAKAGKKAKPAHAKASAPRAESKGAKILELIGRPKGLPSPRSEGHGLAGPQRPGLPLDRRQEGPQDRVHEDRGRRPRISDQKVEVPI
jgi:hypothetical protein